MQVMLTKFEYKEANIETCKCGSIMFFILTDGTIKCGLCGKVKMKGSEYNGRKLSGIVER